MSREFVGVGRDDGQTLTVYIEENGTRQSFMHRVYGAYVDYSWDGAGPGSADLAQALLWEVTGVEPSWRTYRLFRGEVVSKWPRGTGECWRLSEDEIRGWLARLEQDTAQGENTAQTTARQAQNQIRETRLKEFAVMLKKRYRGQVSTR